MFQFDLCVVGGCGHVGLPLAIAFAESGLRVSIYDIDCDAVKTVSAGVMPFCEEGAADLLRAHVGKTLHASTQPDVVAQSQHVVVVIGTPVDEHLNPTFYAMRRFFNGLTPYLRDGQCIVLFFIIYPATTAAAAQPAEQIQ